MTRKRILHDLKITEISAVDRPCQEGARMTIMKRAFTADERKKLAEEGKALPDGSYPIVNRGDLSNAITALGRATNKDEVKRHIIARAKALDAVDALPEDWKVSKVDTGPAGGPAGDLANKENSMTGAEKVADLIKRVADLTKERDAAADTKKAELIAKIDDLNKQLVDEIKKQLEAATVSADAKKMADLASQVETLTKQAAESKAAIEKLTVEKAEAEKIAKLSQDEKDFMTTLDAAGKKKFLAMEDSERADAMKVKKAGDEVVKIEGREIRKSVVGADTFEIMKAQAKRIADNEAAITKAEEKAAKAEFEKRADDVYPHVPGTTEERGSMLKAVAKMDEPLRKSFEAVLTQSEALAKTAFEKLGVKPGEDPAALRKGAKDFEKRVSDLVTSEKLSKTAAMEKAAGLYPEEFKAYQAAPTAN